MQNLILFLDAAEVLPTDAGGKGVNLAELVRARFPVPAGFILTTAAYRAFLEANDLGDEIIALARRAAGADRAGQESLSQTIRQRIEAGEMPREVAAAIAQAHAALGDIPLAVRSSATTGDLLEANAGGQLKSYLNVTGLTSLLAAVKRCWSGLWTARAMAYRHGQHIEPGEVNLAVVVQQMVPADVAGVAYTANPVTGNRSELVINAAWGLGEALAAGQVSPDTVIIDKMTGDVKRVEVADKVLMSVATANGTSEVAVPAGRRRQPSLTRIAIAEVALLSLAIESHFGRPQAIDWAMAGGHVFVLGSRPVTAWPGPAKRAGGSG